MTFKKSVPKPLFSQGETSQTWVPKCFLSCGFLCYSFCQNSCVHTQYWAWWPVLSTSCSSERLAQLVGRCWLYKGFPQEGCRGCWKKMFRQSLESKGKLQLSGKESWYFAENWGTTSRFQKSRAAKNQRIRLKQQVRKGSSKSGQLPSGSSVSRDGLQSPQPASRIKLCPQWSRYLPSGEPLGLWLKYVLDSLGPYELS